MPVVAETATGQPPAPEWHVRPGLSPYTQTLAVMEALVAEIADNGAREQIWLIEHPPVLTAGTSAESADLVDADRFPVVHVGRGGRFTYHGPGQRVVYPMLNLGQRNRDVHAYVTALETWVIAALADFGVHAFVHDAGTGIWVDSAGGIAKIGAIGVRIRRWVTFHGLAINVATDLSHFDAIIPCGIAGRGVARLVDLAPGAGIADLDAALHRHLPALLQAITAAPAAIQEGA